MTILLYIMIPSRGNFKTFNLMLHWHQLYITINYDIHCEQLFINQLCLILHNYKAYMLQDF